MATKEKKKELTIKLVRGRAAANKKQAKILDALGLRKTHALVQHDASPTILGMIDRVKHLVEVIKN